MRQQQQPQQQRQNILTNSVYNTPEFNNRHSVMVTDRKYVENDINEQHLKTPKHHTEIKPGGNNLMPINEQLNNTLARHGHSKKSSADFRIIEEVIKTPSLSPSPE